MATIINNNCYTCSNVPKKCSSGCIQIIPGSCVKYTGPFISNLDIRTGDTMDIAFQKISIAISQAGIIPSLQQVTQVGNSTNLSIIGITEPANENSNKLASTAWVVQKLQTVGEADFTNSYFDI